MRYIGTLTTSAFGGGLDRGVPHQSPVTARQRGAPSRGNLLLVRHQCIRRHRRLCRVETILGCGGHLDGTASGAKSVRAAPSSPNSSPWENRLRVAYYVKAEMGLIPSESLPNVRAAFYGVTLSPPRGVRAPLATPARHLASPLRTKQTTNPLAYKTAMTT
jgi:hypothetical protein